MKKNKIDKANTKPRLHHITSVNEGNDTLKLADGTKIVFYHSQDCCEEVYADLTALEDTGFFEDTSIRFNNLYFEKVDGYGIRLNGYGIPCYNTQNGYYNSDITVAIIALEIDVDTDLGIFNER